jgi:hypothetical protein
MDTKGKDVRTDPTPLTGFFLRRPVIAASLSGLLIAGWVLALDLPLFVAVGVGIAIGLVQWLLWHDGGPGFRWRQAMLRRFPKKE